MMSKIGPKDTKPEKIVRSFLYQAGFRYRLNDKTVFGKPDLVLRKYNAVIFVHGCFWHRHENCKYSYNPKSNTEFWLQKFDQNVQRDLKVASTLKEEGWRIAVVWECKLKKKEGREEYLNSLVDWLNSEELSFR